MGTNIRMLSECVWDSPYEVTPVRLELEECVHFHTDNMRLVWTTDEFAEFARIFEQAKERMDELGWPEKSGHMQRLAGELLQTRSMQHNRWAIEFTRGNWIHIHLGNNRILLSLSDFISLSNMFREASVEFYKEVKTTINLNSDNIIYPDYVVNTYLPMIQEYEELGEKINPAEIGRLKYEVDQCIRHRKDISFENIQRKMDEPFEFKYGRIPDGLDREYLCAIYESIKEWGYADGPFYGELIHAIQRNDGKISIRNAHRVAALLALGYSEVDVFLTGEK